MRYRLLLSLLFFFNLCLVICADKATISCNEILTAWNRFSISEPVDIEIQGVPYEGYWPDGKICMMKSDEKYICYWGEGSSFRTSSTSPLLENHKINWDNLVYGKNKGGVEGFYDGGAWIIGVHSLGNDKLVGFFHAESHWDEYPYEGAYKSIGVTYSYDNGITWSEGKRIISTDYSKPDSPAWCGLGDGCVVWNSELKSFICYYSASSGGDYRICMAASPDLEGKPGTWKKWDGTNFTNEGCNPYSQLGGKDVYIEGLYQVSGSNPSVMWNTFLNRWIMTYASWRGQIYLSSSLDGINWEEPILAFSENEKQTYPNLISTEGDCVGGQSLRLYYGHNQGDDGRRKLAYREIIFEKAYSPADVNNDGMMAIDDVVLTINAVLGNTSENFVFDAADMNGDGQILIDDVVKVINEVLGVNTSAASNARRADINESFILNHTESGLGMSVSNAAGYAALQYDLQLPEGAEVADVRFTGKSNHKVTFREMDGNVVRVTVVSLTNEAFSGNELLDVMIDSAQDAEISIENAIVATCNGAVSKVQNAYAKIGGNATAIDQLLDGMARADVYDLNGKLVKKNAATATGLQKGIYIINGKKISVK